MAIIVAIMTTAVATVKMQALFSVTFAAARLLHLECFGELPRRTNENEFIRAE